MNVLTRKFNEAFFFVSKYAQKIFGGDNTPEKETTETPENPPSLHIKSRQFVSTATEMLKLDDSFSRSLLSAFKEDKNTVRQVIETLNDLQLPVPKKSDEFLWATEGVLIFSNQYGVVIRIERKKALFLGGNRVNDNPWIIQPLGTFEAGNAVIEICPGCHAATKEEISRDVKKYLQETGIRFWDSGARNVGVLPFKTPSFPEGVPVVIDRLAVEGLTKGLERIKKALATIGSERDPQEELYGPLREALKNAWLNEKPDPEKMQSFWQLCADYVREGKLIAGWNETVEVKADIAKNLAKSYDQKIKQRLTETPTM